MKLTKSVKAKFELFFLAALLLCPTARAAVGFTVTPAAVSNNYNGPVTLMVTNLTAGATVVVQKYLDANTNGVVDAGDSLVQQFNLTDGQAGMVIGGIINSNVPGDTDATANGQITARLNFRNGDFMQNIIAPYLYVLSSPTAAFTPVTNAFTVTNASHAQTLFGIVAHSSIAVPDALVILFPAPRPGHDGPGNPMNGVLADNSGHYSIQVSPGTYVPVAFKSNDVADLSASPIITVTNGQSSSNNLNLIPTGATISGTLEDATNSSLVLPGVFEPATAGSLLGFGFSGSNGLITLRVGDDVWNFASDDAGLIVHGYVGYNNGLSIDTTSGDVTGQIFPIYKATALFYGSVKDTFGNPIPGVGLNDSDTNSFSMDGYTDANGNYAVGAVANPGDPWQLQISGDASPTNYIFSQPDFDSNNGTNINTGQAIQVNFTGLPATNTISGKLEDDNGQPITNIGIFASTTISNISYNTPTVDTDTNGNYVLNVGAGDWMVGVNAGSNCNNGDCLGANYLAPQSADVVVSNANVALNFIALNVPYTISGFVTNSSGSPVDNVGVSGAVTVVLSGVTNTFNQYVDTSGSGFYSFPAGNGAWTVGLNCSSGSDNLASQGYQCVASQGVQVTNASASLNFVAQSYGAIISGRVVDDGGNPVTNMNVFAFTVGGGSNYQGTTDGSGFFNINLNGGNFTLQLNNDTNSGYPALGLVGPSVPVSITNGFDLTNFILVAPRVTGKIQVQVNNPGSAGLPGIGVFATLTNGSTNYLTYGGEMATDNSGAATLPVFSGIWQVSLDCNQVQNQGDLCPSSQNATNSNNTNTVTFNLSNGSSPSNTIAVSASPGNGGTVGGNGIFASGSTNTVTATATNGFIFTDWTVSNIVVSALANYTFVLSNNVTLVAHFLPLYMLTVNASPTNGGAVSGGGSYVTGSTNTVTATATNGFIFTNWTSNSVVVSVSNNYTFTLNTNVTLVAHFLPLYTITVSASPTNGGTAGGNGTFVSGSTNTVTATATNGFIFTDWTSNSVVVSVSHNYIFTLNTNVILVANFLPSDTITASASPTNGGTVSGGGIFATGSTNTVTATATNGFIFTNWTSNSVVVSISNNYTFTLNTNVTLVANFLPLYTLGVSASPTNGGTVSGGGAFVAGSTNTVTATVTNGFVFTNWTSNSVVVSTSNNYTLTLNTNVTLVANFLPLYTITLSALPANGGTVSVGGTNGGIFPAGTSQTITATTNSGFEFVGWSGDAGGTNNPLMVTVNKNLNITANFSPAGTNITLTVITNVDGIVLPNLNGKNLKAGRSYTLTAIAASGNVFSNWTGSITSDNNPLHFVITNSMVLQANFIPNPFLAVKGTYNGLFTTTNGVTEQTAGMLKGLAVSQKGTYSGALLINGGSHPISGSFNLAGQATNKIGRPASQGGPLTVVMELVTSSNLAPQVTGTVFGTNNGVPWVATNLLADFATNSLPSAEYTMLFAPDTNNAPPANSPGGAGYALITNYPGTAKNPASAAAKITGALADGTAFNQTVPVSQDGYVPIYANLYANKGLLLGWINLDLTNTAGVSLTWIHPERPSGLYRQGFTNVLLTNQILLSPWTNPPGNLVQLTNLSMLNTINDTNGVNFAITTTAGGKVTGALVSGTINPKTGLLKVTVGSGAARTNGYGAILLNITNGGGYFLTKTNGQAIKLGP